MSDVSGGTAAYSRYVALGDSTTEGLEDPYPGVGGYRGWADRLAERLATLNPDLTYANLAIRGRKLPQIRAEQLEPALALRPDLASILGGLNDILRRHVSVEGIAADLDAMVEALRGVGADVVMMTFPDPTEVITVGGSRVRPRVADFNSRVRAIASERGAVLVDLDRDGVTHRGLFAPDRLHANEHGHELMAATAAVALGVGEHDPAAAVPPAPPRQRRAVGIAGDALWAGRHLGPWVVRRVRGRSSGDGRVAKRPELEPPGPGARGRDE